MYTELYIFKGGINLAELSTCNLVVDAILLLLKFNVVGLLSLMSHQGMIL